MADPARVRDVADAVTAFVKAAWNPVDPDGVETCYLARMFFDEENQATMHRGRRVYVMPAEHRLKALTRGQWLNAYAVMVLVVERYTDAGQPPDDWIDERVRWWEQTLLYPLANPALQLVGPAGIVPCAMLDPEQPPELVTFVDREQVRRFKAVNIAVTFFYIDASDFTGAG